MKSWLKREGIWWKKHWDTVVAIATIAAAVGAICWTWIWSNFDISDRVQMTTGIGTLALVIAAAIYAWHTRKLSQATKEQVIASSKQAEASVKMAEAIAKPAMFPNFADAKFPKIRSIKFKNLGSGAAINGEIRFAYSQPDVVRAAWLEKNGQYGSSPGIQNPTWSILEPGNSHACYPELTGQYPGSIGTAFAIYSDIYGRRFLSGWGYQCEKEGSSDRIILQPTEPIYPIPEKEAEHD